MDEPPNYSLQILLSSPGLYALGFTFFIFLFLSAILAVVEVILSKSKNVAGDKEAETTSWPLKHIYDELRVYLVTWKVLDTLVTISMLVVAISFFSLFFTSEPILLASVVILIFGIEIFGKILLKVLSLKYLNSTVKILFGVLKSAVKICKPITTLLLKADTRLTRNISKPDQLREEISNALERAIKNDDDAQDQKEILKGIVTFSTLRVRQVMRGRADIAALNIGLNFHELLQKINSYGFSRIPVFKNLTDQLEGVLYSKDLLPFLDHDASFEWQKLIRPGFFVSETKRLDSLLKEFQEKHIHIALVLNEQKRVSGIITMEDVIEEIIEDINDAFDEVKPPIDSK